MELDVSQAFVTPGTEFPFKAALSLPPQDVTGEAVTFGEVRLQGVYTMLDGSVQLRGTLGTVAHAVCARCLEPVQVPLRIDFAEWFRNGANETEDEYFRLEGQSVPLAGLSLALVMLNLPLRFLCGESCLGHEALQAWYNQYDSSSRENGARVQRPFEALQSLLKKDEEV